MPGAGKLTSAATELDRTIRIPHKQRAVYTEGCNNTIKVLKRVCYGFRNFENFRRRILFILNNEERIARRTKKA